MKINQKILLLSLMPLIVVILLISAVINYKADELTKIQSDIFYDAILAARKAELISYTNMARSAIKEVYASPDLSEEKAQEIVKNILNNLEYAQDGYFYAYTKDGTSIVHPKQSYRLGENWIDLQDSEGKYIIRDLINVAYSGGGFVSYLWEKPSLGVVGRKLGYAEMIEPWGWMFGTGMYIDDLSNEVQEVASISSAQIKNTSAVIFIITLIALTVVFLIGMLLQISERRLADTKLKELTQRVLTTQEEERRRVSRELHDGISQSLVAIKYALETAEYKIEHNENTDGLITKSARYLEDTLNEVRRISRDLHPSILDDLGLGAAIEALAKTFTERTRIPVEINRVQVRNILPEDAKATLYRVTQEALMNIERHSGASKVVIELSIEKSSFNLSISDNGKGFDVVEMKKSKNPSTGIGLRNISERLRHLKGKFDIHSSMEGTTIVVKLPKSIMKYRGNI